MCAPKHEGNVLGKLVRESSISFLVSLDSTEIPEASQFRSLRSSLKKEPGAKRVQEVRFGQRRWVAVGSAAPGSGVVPTSPGFGPRRKPKKHNAWQKKGGLGPGRTPEGKNRASRYILPL